MAHGSGGLATQQATTNAASGPDTVLSACTNDPGWGTKHLIQPVCVFGAMSEPSTI